MAHDDVGLPVADETGDGAAILECGLELAVMDVEHVGGDAQDARALLHFVVAALRQRAAGLAEVADVAVGHRDELHLVALRCPERGHACRFQLGVVRVGAKGNDAQRLGLREQGDAGNDKRSTSREVSEGASSNGRPIRLPAGSSRMPRITSW